MGSPQVNTRYHIKAGTQIKLNLRKSISNDDLTMLNNQGYQVFKIEGTEASIGFFELKKLQKKLLNNLNLI